MEPSDYYTSGVFAKMAHISLRTVRYYDQQNILKPTYVAPNGRRYYSDQDFVRLQQILLLKYLGFSLEEIKELTIAGQDERVLVHSLELQRKLVQDQMEHLKLVEQALHDMSEELRQDKAVDWSDMLNLIHLTGMENRLQTNIRILPIFLPEFDCTVCFPGIQRAGFPGCMTSAASVRGCRFWKWDAAMADCGSRINPGCHREFMSFFQIFQTACCGM